MRHRKKQPAAGNFARHPAAGALAAVLLFTLVSCAETTLPEEGPVFIKAEKTVVSQCSEDPAPPADEYTEETETGEPDGEQAEPAGTEPVPAEAEEEAGGTDEMPQKPAGPEENDAGTEEPEDPAPADTSYTFTDVTKTVYAATDLNIRSGPSAAFAVIGSFDEGDAVTVTGVCCETGWYRVDLNGAAGYCDAAYTADAVSSAQPETGDENDASSAAPVSAGEGGVSESYVELCRQAYGMAPSRVREAFEEAGWQIKVRSGTWWPAYGYSLQLNGLTVYGEKTIYISARDDACNAHILCHELGHFVDNLLGTPSLSAGFQSIYSAEYRQFCSFFGYSNGYPGPEELFAEGLFEYWTSPGDLAAAAPGTYAFLRDLSG